jgi:hypothetical protein
MSGLLSLENALTSSTGNVSWEKILTPEKINSIIEHSNGSASRALNYVMTDVEARNLIKKMVITAVISIAKSQANKRKASSYSSSSSNPFTSSSTSYNSYNTSPNPAYNQQPFNTPNSYPSQTYQNPINNQYSNPNPAPTSNPAPTPLYKVNSQSAIIGGEKYTKHRLLKILTGTIVAALGTSGYIFREDISRVIEKHENKFDMETILDVFKTLAIKVKDTLGQKLKDFTEDSETKSTKSRKPPANSSEIELTSSFSS